MKQIQKTGPSPFILRHKTAVSLALLALMTQLAQAQSVGVSNRGVSGGLAIPYADVLSPGTLALTYGNYKEPQLGGPVAFEQNMSLGVGLFPNVEFFGRFAEYTNELAPGKTIVNGVRDISANLKVQVPMPWADGPKFALGFNDISGKNGVFFKSTYAVATDQYGPFKLALGYAKGKTASTTVNQPPLFDGAFGGVNVRLTDNGLSALAEYDGQQKHLGLRWISPPIASLANSQLIGNVQRSSGAFDGPGTSVAVNKLGVSLVIPVGENALAVAKYKPSAAQALPPIDDKGPSGGMQATAQDKLESLQKALVVAGLERVRVGQNGSALVVEYENHRYAHNEADALGIVFGLGAEMAPRGSSKIIAVTLKDGLRVYDTSVDVAAFRAFLRDGPASHVRDSLSWNRGPFATAGKTEWVNILPGKHSLVRLELKPDLNYTIGTELGALDYSLAANLQLTAPLWAGARFYSSYLTPVGNTPNMDTGAIFDVYKHRTGFSTLALEQSFWFGKQMLTNVSLGRFHHDTLGAQAQAMLFVPGSDDVIKASGAFYNEAPGGLAGKDRAFSASYRHMLSPTTWIEGGAQQYSDGSRGPSLQLNRWFGDVAVQVFYRKGGSHQFAGLELSFPLTPRQGMAPNTLFFAGASQYAQSIRTQLTTGGAEANFLMPGAVKDLKFASSIDDHSLNAGRASQGYLSGEVYRMRDAFFKFSQ